jgi:hypothetical protein
MAVVGESHSGSRVIRKEFRDIRGRLLLIDWCGLVMTVAVRFHLKHDFAVLRPITVEPLKWLSITRALCGRCRELFDPTPGDGYESLVYAAAVIASL